MLQDGPRHDAEIHRAVAEIDDAAPSATITVFARWKSLVSSTPCSSVNEPPMAENQASASSEIAPPENILDRVGNAAEIDAADAPVGERKRSVSGQRVHDRIGVIAVRGDIKRERGCSLDPVHADRVGEERSGGDAAEGELVRERRSRPVRVDRERGRARAAVKFDLRSNAADRRAS